MRLIAFFIIACAVGLTAFFSIDVRHLSAQTKQGDMLKQFQWNARPILIFANATDSSDYVAQIKIVKDNQDTLKDRDNIVLSIIDKNVTDLNGKAYEINAGSLREKYDAQTGLHVVLIGKDGGTKLQKQNVTTMNELNDLIDSMPMRQSEMNR